MTGVLAEHQQDGCHGKHNHAIKPHVCDPQTPRKDTSPIWLFIALLIIILIIGGATL